IDSDVNAGSRKLPLLDQVIKPVRDLLVRNQFRRTVIIACKLRDVSAVRLLSAFCPATNGKIPDVFCSKWCCHRRLLCRLWIHRRRQPLTDSAKRLRSKELSTAMWQIRDISVTKIRFSTVFGFLRRSRSLYHPEDFFLCLFVTHFHLHKGIDQF